MSVVYLPVAMLTRTVPRVAELKPPRRYSNSGSLLGRPLRAENQKPRSDAYPDRG